MWSRISAISRSSRLGSPNSAVARTYVRTATGRPSPNWGRDSNPRSTDQNRCPPAGRPPNGGFLRRRYYDATVPAPTVVILAAGEGTRMRSSLPKVLHPLCGRPLIAWPVAAAPRGRGGEGRRGRRPEAPLADHLPEGVVVAVQAEPQGRATRSPPPPAHIDRGDDRGGRARATSRSSTRRDADGARRGPRGRRTPPRRWLTAELEDPTRLRARGPRRRGPGRARRRDQGRRATRRRGRARDPRGQHRHLRLRRRRAARRARAARVRQRPGRALPPDVLPRMREAGREIAAHVATDWTSRSASTTASTSRGSAPSRRSASTRPTCARA